jgi:hypothetical protein
MLFTLGTVIAVPTHAWTGIAYYGGFGVVLVVLALAGPRLRNLDARSLRTRLALVLAATAAVPLLVLVPLFVTEQENQALADVLARQQTLASVLAQNVTDYVTLYDRATHLLAGQPGLLALSPGQQQAVLANSSAHSQM